MAADRLGLRPPPGEQSAADRLGLSKSSDGERALVLYQAAEKHFATSGDATSLQTMAIALLVRQLCELNGHLAQQERSKK